MASYPISVVDTSPAKSALGVARNTVISVSFNRDLGPTSLTGNFIVEKKVNETTFTNVTGSITYESKVATFTPSANLDASSVYRITIIGDTTGLDSVVSGVKDIFGNGMLGTFVSTFSTSDAPVLTKPTITLPASNTIVYKTPDIEWSDMNAISYDIQISPASDFSVDLWSTTVIDNTSVTPNITLIEGAYFCRVRYTVDSGVSQWSETIRFYYSTTESNEIEETEFLEVIETNPNDMATNVSTNVFIFRFNSSIDSDTISPNTVKLTKLPGISVQLLDEDIVVNEDTLTITKALITNSEYMITICEEVSSIDGEKLATNFIITFTTEYSPLYADYNDVVTDLVPLTGEIIPHIIYKAIRDASLTAKSIRTDVESKNITSIATDWDDIENLDYYIKQYVRYQAGYDAFLNSYMIRVSNFGTMKQLGDFLVQSNVGISQDVNSIITMLKERIKPWLDRLMDFGYSRGYAKPVGAIRGENSRPYLDWHSRATFKEYGA